MAHVKYWMVICYLLLRSSAALGEIPFKSMVIQTNLKAHPLLDSLSKLLMIKERTAKGKSPTSFMIQSVLLVTDEEVLAI